MKNKGDIRQRNKWLDMLKAVACIMVVLIHCIFPGWLGIMFRALARFAVPLFFMVSGYFFYSSDKTKMNAQVLGKVKHLMWIVLFSGIGYIVLEIAEKFFLTGDGFVFETFFAELISWEIIVRFLLTNTPIVYMPRWFLWALIYCYLFVWVYNKFKLKDKWLYLCAVIFMAGNLMLEFFCVLGGNDIGIRLGNSDIYVWIRNLFIIRALPWFAIGMMFRQYKGQVVRISKSWYYVGVSAGVLLVIVQAFLFGDFQVYIGTILMTFAMYGLALKYEKASCSKVGVYIGDKLSMYVYIIHGAVISAMSLVERSLFKQTVATWFVWIKPIVVVLLSLLGSQIIYILISQLKKRKQMNEK